MTDLDHIIEDYIVLERRIQLIMQQGCSIFCGQCQNCCCRYDICEESLDSAFLSAIRKRTPPADQLSDSYGWLTSKGCALLIGRPPVCYEFLCDDIMNNLPNDSVRYALRTLGMLLTFVGTHALGKQHLIEILNEHQLSQVKYKRFRKRMDEAQRALTDIKTILQNPDRTHPSEDMMKICGSDAELYQGL